MAARVGEEAQAALRPATDFDHPGPGGECELVEQPGRFIGELSRLQLESLLFVLPIAQEVLVSMWHFRSSVALADCLSGRHVAMDNHGKSRLCGRRPDWG
jgi:hypothetical protein